MGKAPHNHNCRHNHNRRRGTIAGSKPRPPPASACRIIVRALLTAWGIPRTTQGLGPIAGHRMLAWFATKGGAVDLRKSRHSWNINMYFSQLARVGLGSHRPRVLDRREHHELHVLLAEEGALGIEGVFLGSPECTLITGALTDVVQSETKPAQIECACAFECSTSELLNHVKVTTIVPGCTFVNPFRVIVLVGLNGRVQWNPEEPVSSFRIRKRIDVRSRNSAAADRMYPDLSITVDLLDKRLVLSQLLICRWFLPAELPYEWNRTEMPFAAGDR